LIAGFLLRFVWVFFLLFFIDKRNILTGLEVGVELLVEVFAGRSGLALGATTTSAPLATATAGTASTTLASSRTVGRATRFGSTPEGLVDSATRAGKLKIMLNQ
jgi:hypothetical protein